MKRRYRRNGITKDDLMYIGVAAVAAGGIGFLLGKRQTLPVATSTSGLGAYFVDPVVQQISGLGSNYVRVR